jgi:hypothetical protein
MAACSHVNFAAPRATPWHVALTGATAGADAVQAACIIYVYNIHNGSSRTPGKQRGGRGVISSSRDDSYCMRIHVPQQQAYSPILFTCNRDPSCTRWR